MPVEEIEINESTPASIWEDIYKRLKSGDISHIRTKDGATNPINAAILANAPHKVIELMINRLDTSLLTKPSSKFSNITLHFLLGTKSTEQGTKKEIDHSLVRLVLKKAPESITIRNSNGHLRINLITE